jgi:hypothetical protein
VRLGVRAVEGFWTGRGEEGCDIEGWAAEVAPGIRPPTRAELAAGKACGIVTKVDAPSFISEANPLADPLTAAEC